MSRRAAFGVLVVPYTVDLDGRVRYALFRGVLEPEGGWHALRGTALRGETPRQAARREAHELAGIPTDAVYFTLDSRATIDPADASCHGTEYAFGVRACEDEVRCIAGGFDHRWVIYEVARGLAGPPADRDALWELQRRLGRPVPAC